MEMVAAIYLYLSIYWCIFQGKESLFDFERCMKPEPSISLRR